MNRLVAVCLVMALAGCDTSAPLGFTDPQWSLQGVVSDSTIRVLITSSGSDLPAAVALRVWAEDEWFVDLEEVGPTECVSSPHPDADGIRCFSATVATLASAGATYTVTGVADGRELEGSTIVPEAADWTAQSPRIDVDTVPVFAGPEPAARITLIREDTATYWMELSLSVLTVFENDIARSPDCDVSSLSSIPFPATRDEATVTIQTFHCLQPWDSAYASVEVRRFDENLGSYFEAVASGVSGVASFGLSGAWGYWGSVSSSTIPIVLLPKEEPAIRDESTVAKRATK